MPISLSIKTAFLTRIRYVYRTSATLEGVQSPADVDRRVNPMNLSSVRAHIVRIDPRFSSTSPREKDILCVQRGSHVIRLMKKINYNNE